MPINLAPEEENKDTQTRYYFKGIIKLGIYTFLGVIFIIGAKYGWNYYQIYNLNKELATVNSERQPYQEYYDSYQKYINHEARTVLANHPYFSQLINYFEESVTSNIVITSMTFNKDLTASAQGYSKKGIKPFSVFENNLEKRGFSNLAVTTLILNQGNRVDFSITFNYNQERVRY